MLSLAFLWIQKANSYLPLPGAISNSPGVQCHKDLLKVQFNFLQTLKQHLNYYTFYEGTVLLQYVDDLLLCANSLESYKKGSYKMP